MRALIVSLLMLWLGTGCYRHKRYAAPPTPDRVVPSVSLAGAPAPGLGRVVVDVAEGPAVVENVRGAGVTGVAGTRVLAGSLEVSQRVCVTPCVLDLSPGPHELRFTLVGDGERTSTGFVNVDERPVAYRHALGIKRNKAWKGVVGWPVLLLGVLLDIGMISVAADGDLDLTKGGHIVGIGFSLGATALGGWLVAGSVIEDQPGNGVTWHL